MSYISQANMDAIRVNPAKFAELVPVVLPNLKSELGSDFSAMSDDGFIACFASQVAYDMKPYAGSTATSFRALLAADGLDCDNYARLAWNLFRVARPYAALPTRIIAAGWDDGPVGNHAQIVVQGTGCKLLLDPTIGAIAKINATDLVKGIAVTPRFLSNSRAIDSSVSGFKTNVVNALQNGTYAFEHCRYFLDMDDPQFEDFFTNKRWWATPQVALSEV